MSPCSAISSRMKPPCASILPECRSPPRGLATARPCSNASRRQRIALDTLTPKRAAAAWQLSPPSIAATTRSRRSCDSVRAIHAGLLPPAGRLNHNGAAKGIPDESDRVETALKYAEKSVGRCIIIPQAVIQYQCIILLHSKALLAQKRMGVTPPPRPPAPVTAPDSAR